MLLNRKAVRSHALDFAAQTRAKKFTRVSTAFLNAMEVRLRTAIEAHVRTIPSKGKTI